MLDRLQYRPPWKLTRWGFLPEYLFRLNRGCDEWHNQSRFVVIPLLGELVVFVGPFDRTGPEHLFAYGPEGWAGHHKPGCPTCEEIVDDVISG